MFQSYNKNMRISARASRSALPDKRTRTQISFRQYLIPKNISNVLNYSQNDYNIQADILSAIGDQSYHNPQLRLIKKIINLYKKLGFVLIPQYPILIFWQILVFLLINFYILQLGFLLGFGATFWIDELSYLFGLHIAFIFIFFLDIILSPLKAYYDEGLLIKDVSIILRKYAKVQLWIDIIALLSIIIPIAISNVQSNWLKIIWIAKIYSMIKIVKDLQRLTQLSLMPNTIFQVFKLTLYCYLYSHYIGIFFYMISLSIYQSNYYGPNTPNLVWVYNSWAFYQMAFLPWYQMYLYIMYFSITFITTIAYGDITPKNPLECIYMIFAFIFQTILWGYLLAQIIRFLMNVYNYNFTRRYQHYSLNFKLKTILIPESTFKKVQIHTEEIDREERFRNRELQDQILSLMPPDPLYGLLLTIYNKYLFQMGFQFVFNLNYKSLGSNDKKSLFLESFMRGIHQIRLFAGDVLYEEAEREFQKQNNHAAYCYVDSNFSQSVVLGVGQQIKIQAKPQKLQIAKREINTRCFQLKRPKATFGQVQFLNGEERSHWAVCVKNCLMFVAPRQLNHENYHLLTVEEKEVIKICQQKIKERSCLICRKRHDFKQCPYAFVSKVNLDTSEKSGRIPVNRYLHCSRQKTMNSWILYGSIKDVKITISKSYKDRLFYDKAANELFVELQLQQNCSDQLEDIDIEHELFETQVIIESLYRNQLKSLGLSAECWSCDSVYNYSKYKPASNVEQVSKAFQKNKKARKNRKNDDKN